MKRQEDMPDQEGEMRTAIREVDGDADIKKVEQLADEIWTEHYTPIIGTDQVRYMLEKFQSYKAISQQISEGMTYFLMYFDEEAVGYMASRPDNEDLFLSKIYVVSRMRGKGIGGHAMNFLSTLARERHYSHLSLTVNKNNISSIRAYEKLGFVNLGPVETDIGNGFIMDDYYMKKSL